MGEMKGGEVGRMVVVKIWNWSRDRMFKVVFTISVVLVLAAVLIPAIYRALPGHDIRVYEPGSGWRVYNDVNMVIQTARGFEIHFEDTTRPRVYVSGKRVEISHEVRLVTEITKVRDIRGEE